MSPRAMKWPKNSKGQDMPVCLDTIRGIKLCQQCWDGKHRRGGCKAEACECGCYAGRNKGLGRAHPPTKDCQENQSFPDAGTITV